MSPSTQGLGLTDDVERRANDEPLRWTLTAAALHGLLNHLNSDSDRAAERYEALRRRVEMLFRLWGSSWNAAELADRTLDRLARKVGEGAEIADAKLGAYIRSVARLIFHESLREEKRQEAVLRTSVVPPPSRSDEDEEMMGALEASLEQLDEDERRLVLRYYATDDLTMIETRKQLAAELSLSPLALRLRAHRIRKRLESSLRRT